jgi:hypothetical protein
MCLPRIHGITVAEQEEEFSAKADQEECQIGDLMEEEKVVENIMGDLQLECSYKLGCFGRH